MLEKYKVLGAALTFREFTVKDIAAFSEVNPSTVRTILKRNQAFLEELGPDETGRPGGRFTRYAVKADQIKPLRQMIESLYKQLKVSPESEPHSSSGAEAKGPGRREHTAGLEDSVDLLAAEDALLRLFPKTQNHDERQYLLRLAEFHADTAQAQLEQMLEVNAQGEEQSTEAAAVAATDGVRAFDFRARARVKSPEALIFKARMRGVKVLGKLCKAELLADSGEGVGAVNISALRDELLQVSHELSQFEQWKHASAITTRALESRLISADTEEVKKEAAQNSVKTEKEAAAPGSPHTGPSSSSLTPIIQRVQSISRINDRQRRRAACASAAHDYRRLFSPSDQTSHSVAQRISEGAVVRLNEREVRVLAAEPEFYYLAVEPEYRQQLASASQGKGVLLNSLSYIEAALDYKSGGGRSGSIARWLTGN
jgi:hypothetical protein